VIVNLLVMLAVVHAIDYLWEKYKKAPQTTIDSLDGTPNYQSLDSGPPNYQTLAIWLPPLICAVILEGKHYMCRAHDV